MDEPTGVSSASGSRDTANPRWPSCARSSTACAPPPNTRTPHGRAAETRAAMIERELLDHKSRSARAYEAIEELREQLETLRGAEPDAPNVRTRRTRRGPRERPSPAPTSRQSAATPPAPESARPMPAADVSQGRWLERALRQLARRSPPLAGRLLVVLVPGAEMEQERLVEMLAAGQAPARPCTRARRRQELGRVDAEADGARLDG